VRPSSGKSSCVSRTTGCELGSGAGALLDQPCQALRQRDAARLDSDERDFVEIRVRFDDLVGDAGERPRQRIGVEQDLPGFGGMRRHSTPSRPRWTELKGSSLRKPSVQVG